MTCDPELTGTGNVDNNQVMGEVRVKISLENTEDAALCRRGYEKPSSVRRAEVDAIGDREMDTNCLVGPPQCEPLIGQIVLEQLDLIIDPLKKTLTPHPESPFLPSLKLKQL